MFKKYSSNMQEDILSFIKERLKQLGGRLSDSEEFKLFKDLKIEKYSFKLSNRFFINDFGIDTRDELIHAIKGIFSDPEITVNVKLYTGEYADDVTFFIKRENNWFEELDIEENDGCRD